MHYFYIMKNGEHAMDKKKCFVIMPFSKTTEEHDEKYWTTFFATIKEVMEELGYDCTRSEVGPYNLLTNIIVNIDCSDIVIAVLTDFNPNVWYELGIRHTLKTGTIMLLQEGQNPPFDIGNYGIIFYEYSSQLHKYFKEEIRKYLAKYNDTTCDSPVIRTLGKTTINNDVESQLKDMKNLLSTIFDEIVKSGQENRNRIKRKDGVRANSVLWVDDYPINNELVINFLRSKNIHVDIAISTVQGLDYFKQNEYDVIITDMGRGMERDAGIKLIRKLKSMDCRIPIIVYTSKDAIRQYGEDAQSLGAYKVINGTVNIISTLSEILEL